MLVLDDVDYTSGKGSKRTNVAKEPAQKVRWGESTSDEQPKTAAAPRPRGRRPAAGAASAEMLNFLDINSLTAYLQEV